MKRFCTIFAVCSILLLPLIFSSCASTDWSNVDLLEPGDYIGQYDESMTPENSCVIIFSFTSNDSATFRQINPNFESDIQEFKYDGFDILGYNWTIFKPCKPGSRYMLTSLKGSDWNGNFNTTWDMDFSPKQQVLVIDIPEKPGIYVYGPDSKGTYFSIWGLKVAQAANSGRAYKFPEPNGNHTKTIYKTVVKEFAKHYAHTPWYDTFIAKREEILGKK